MQIAALLCELDVTTDYVLHGRGQTVHARPNQDNVHIFNATDQRRLVGRAGATKDPTTVEA